MSVLGDCMALLVATHELHFPAFPSVTEAYTHCTGTQIVTPQQEQ